MTLVPCILSFIGNITYPIFNILTCYIYSPFHQCISDNFGNYFELMIYDFNIINALIGIINLFFSLVASEIIILKFCDLDKNTKIEIQKRANKEQIIINECMEISSDENISDNN